MTFFRSGLGAVRATVAGLCVAVLSACGSGSDVVGYDGGHDDARIRFDAGDGSADSGPDGGDDLGVADMSCGTVGCVSVTSCRAIGSILSLDTDARPSPSAVSAASTATGHVAAFHGFRSSGTNVVTRAIALGGAAMPEQVVSASILFARNPSIALGASGGVVVYETNDPGPTTQIVAHAIDASGAGTGGAQSLTSGSTQSPRLPTVVPLGTGYVAAWLSATVISPTMTGPPTLVVQRLAADGTASGAPSPVSAPSGGAIVSYALAQGLVELPALVTVEQTAVGMDTVRVRPLAADGTVGAPIDVVAGRDAGGGVTGVRAGMGTLVAWGEIVAGSRNEVHLIYAPDTGSPMGERLATVGTETGTEPRLATVTGGIVLAYRSPMGVRAVGVNVFGALAATATTVLDGAADPAHLALSASSPAGVLVVLADDSPTGGSRVRATAVDCGGM